MNKTTLLITAVLITSTLCACAGESSAVSGMAELAQSAQGSQSTRGLPDDRSSQDGLGLPNTPGFDTLGEGAAADNSLQLLCAPDSDSACYSEAGYYYLASEGVKLQDGSHGLQLMYMDFASCKEIYLCSTAGCNHDTPDCPAVYPTQEFPVSSTRLFVFQNQLYILGRSPDDAGSVSYGLSASGESEMFSTQSSAPVLYRANLDGTQRQKVYTFDSNQTLEDVVLGDDSGIYVIAKKLSSENQGGATYTIAAERKLLHLDTVGFSASEICSLEFDDHIAWRMIGCHGNRLVLQGTDFGRELSLGEMWDDSRGSTLYENSSEVYALLDISSGQRREVCRQSNQYDRSGAVLGDTLYLSTSENQSITAVSLDTGEVKTLCTLPQNQIADTLSGMLCCRVWDSSRDQTYYFVNTDTGQVTTSPLVNLTTGWAISFHADLSEDVLFQYDYDAIANADASYEIQGFEYALISKEELFSGGQNYRVIEMVGPGY